MRRFSWQQIGLGVGGLVILALIVALIVRDDSPPTELSVGATSTSSSSSTTEPAPDETTTTSDETTTTALAPTTTRPKTATTRAAVTGTTAAPAPSATVQAPAPGTYRYSEQSSGDGGTTHNEYTLTITAAADEGNGTRRNETNSRGGTDEQAWGPEKVLSLRRSDPNGCSWQPARTLYLTKLQAGATWTTDSTCRVEATYPQTTHDQSSYSVARRDPDGLWVIHVKQRLRLTEENNGAVHTLNEGEGDIWFDPTRGLVVRRHETRKSEDLPAGRTVDTQLL